MKIPILDLQAQYRQIRNEIEPVLRDVFEEQQFVLGRTVGRFEEEMQHYTGSPHAIGCASGSDALLLALMAMDARPRDTVVTTPFTFFATAGAPARLGLRIVFADIEPDTFNLSGRTVRAALERTSRGDGRLILLPVHLYGRMAPMGELLEIAREWNATVIEDAAQSLGAHLEVEGASCSSGALGDFGALSFFPSKNLGGAGDGGMVLVRSPEMAERVRMLRVHGSRRRYEHDFVGINSRLDALQAAILSVKLRHLDDWNTRRRDRAALYTRLFRETALDPGPIQAPPAAGAEHVFHQYVIRATDRDRLRDFLTEAGIGTQIYYPVPLYRQPCFASIGSSPADFPESERASRECLALPLYPELGDEQIEGIVSRIRSFYQ